MAEIDPTTKTDVAVGAFRNGTLLFGNFTLRNGTWAPYYMDLRTIPSVSVNPDRTNMSRTDQLKFRNNVVDMYCQLLDQASPYEHIQSIPEALDHLVGAIGYAHNDSILKRRVKSKGHGWGADGILGIYQPGDVTVLVDDVITSSAAKVEEKQLVEDISRPRDETGEPTGEPGLLANDVVIMLDRGGDAIEKAREAGLEVHAGLTTTELLEISRAEGVMVDEAYMIIEGFRDGTITKPEDISPTWSTVTTSTSHQLFG